MVNETNYRHYLQGELVRRISANPRYSQRAFAKSLGLSPGELSEILSGKRRLTLKKAMKISKSMGLNSHETRHLLMLVENEVIDAETPSSSQDEVEGRKNLEMDIFNIISEWYCFAILNLSECEGFIWSTTWIGRKLGISPLQVKVAIERMMRVGLIEETKDGLKSSEDFIFSPDGIPSQAIRNYHSAILKKATESLETQNLDEREITGLGFAVDPKHIPTIKKEIQEFRDMIAQKYSKGEKTVIYQLELALFKLSEGDTRE
ncbi:MAG: TIGR02147 family protein [Bacteriovoracaceae bacterium]|nr:TIGR02147 family protein [Bacteriovoracaceae bacterium]